MGEKHNKTIVRLLLLFLSIGFVLFISFIFAYWSGYPRGGDAIVHSLKIFWVEKYFPHYEWWHVWVGGMPHLLYYPIAPFIIFSFVSRNLGISPELVLAIAAVVAIGLSGFFLGLLVYHLSSNIFASVFTSFVAISVPAVWFSAVGAGSYMRVVALPFMLGSFYFAVKQALEPERKTHTFWTIALLVLTFITHPLIGLEATGFSLLLLLFITKGFKTKIVTALKTFIPALLILSFYLLPVLIFSSPASYKVGYEGFTLEKVELPTINNILGIYYQPSLLENKNLSQDFTALTPFVVPALVLFLSIALLAKREIFKNRATLLLLLGSFFFLVFSTVKIPILIRAYFFIAPAVSLTFLTMFAAPTIGILIGALDKRLKGVLSIGLIMVLLAWIWFVFAPNPKNWANEIFAKGIKDGRSQFFESIKPPKDQQFRFGTSSDAGLAMIFNRVYPEYPQTRDYFANGIVNDDFNFYFVKAVWDWDNNLDETKFLLDWWAVDKFVATGQASEKFDNFKSPGEFAGYQIYEFVEASPILTAKNTPAVLFVGKKSDYTIFFRALAQANINSTKIIPVYSGSGDLSLDRIEKFPAVFVYAAAFEDGTNLDVLKSYVENGGSLFIEGLWEESASLDEPFPVRGVSKGEVKDSWKLVLSKDIDLVDFVNFSPPVYNQGPWGVGFADELQPWAQVLLSESDRPLIVGGSFGKGKVVWSGMNLLYHTDVYSNKGEALFLENLIDWLLEGKEQQGVDFSVEFVNPEKRIIRFETNPKGVLFKEAYFPKWQAFLEDGNRKTKLEIFKAGPDFMYISLGGNRVERTLVLEYKKSPVEWLSSAISFATFLGLVLWLFDWWIFKPYILRLQQKFIEPFKKVARWWEREEEV